MRRKVANCFRRTDYRKTILQIVSEQILQIAVDSDLKKSDLNFFLK